MIVWLVRKDLKQIEEEILNTGGFTAAIAAYLNEEDNPDLPFCRAFLEFKERTIH